MTVEGGIQLHAHTHAQGYAYTLIPCDSMCENQQQQDKTAVTAQKQTTVHYIRHHCTG